MRRPQYSTRSDPLFPSTTLFRSCVVGRVAGGCVGCAVCSRQAKGLGYFNPRLRRSDPRRYNDRWVFCSMRCQNAFSRLMERLTPFQEDAVIDPSDMEIAAMQSALAPLDRKSTRLNSSH